MGKTIGLLANEEVARAMERQATLLFGGLGRNEAHAWPRDRFADGFGIGGIILLAFEVGPHVGGGHQPNGMAEGRSLFALHEHPVLPEQEIIGHLKSVAIWQPTHPYPPLLKTRWRGTT